MVEYLEGRAGVGRNWEEGLSVVKEEEGKRLYLGEGLSGTE